MKNKKTPLYVALLGIAITFIIFIFLKENTDKNITLTEKNLPPNLKVYEEENILDETEEYLKEDMKEVLKKSDSNSLKKSKQDLVKIPDVKKKPASPNLNKKKINNEIQYMTTLDQLHTTLSRISNGEEISETEVIETIKRSYDVEKMLDLIIGSNWENIDKNTKNELIKTFEEFIAKNYIRRFIKIKKPNFEQVSKKKINDDYFMIRVNLQIDEKEVIPIHYLLNQKEGNLKIFDILLDGSISEIATKKSEFIKFITNGDLNKLIDALKKKNSILLD